MVPIFACQQLFYQLPRNMQYTNFMGEHKISALVKLQHLISALFLVYHRHLYMESGLGQAISYIHHSRGGVPSDCAPNPLILCAFDKLYMILKCKQMETQQLVTATISFMNTICGKSDEICPYSYMSATTAAGPSYDACTLHTHGVYLLIYIPAFSEPNLTMAFCI